MTRTLPRRTLLAAAPAALVSCRQDGRYFGTTRPPAGQRLVYANGNEPDTFDPGTYSGGTEMRIINALFDGLTKVSSLDAGADGRAGHPLRGERRLNPVHVLSSRPSRPPRGSVPNTDDLPAEFSRGRKAPPDSTPARWSDGVPSPPTTSCIPGGALSIRGPGRRTRVTSS